MFSPIVHILTSCFCYYTKELKVCFFWIWVDRGKKCSLFSIWLMLLSSLVTTGATLHLGGCSRFLGCHIKLHKLSGLKQQTFIHRALEARSLKSKCGRPCPLWRLTGILPCPASGGSWQFLAFLGLYLHHSNLCALFTWTYSLHVAFCVFSSYKDTSHWS